MVGLASQLNVIVGKLAELGVVKTKELLLLGDTKGETGNEVQHEQDDAGSDKGVRETGNAICELVTKLDVVVVEPSTWNLTEAIKMCYVVTVKTVSWLIS